MQKGIELKTSFLRFQLYVSDAVIVALLLLSFLLCLCLSFPSSLTTENEHTALAIINTFNATNNTTTPSPINASSVKPATNHPPIANAGPNQIVNENTTVSLVGAGIDSDPTDILSYLWRQTAGPAVNLSNRSSTNPTFISPIVPSDTELKFSLTVTDDKGVTSSPAIVAVTIKHINRPPIADAGINQSVNEGYAVTLDGSASKDPDSDPVTYSWIQTDGPSVKLNDADTSMATFTAPSNISSDTDLIFRLTVTDNKNASSTDDVKVTIKHIPQPNQSPVANAGTDQTVNEGYAVTLDGTASSDSDGSIASYSWKQIEGPIVTLSGADTSKASFTAPIVSSDTQLKFSLTVKDDKGDISSPAIVTVTVKAAAPAPISPSSNISTTEETSPPSKEQYSFVRAWGSNGTENGQFFLNSGIALDSSGNVYATDGGNDRIQKFTSDGTFITKWGSRGKGDGEFSDPDGIAVDSQNNVYVVDHNNHRIQKFTSDGTFITKWGSSGSVEGEFIWPGSIAADSQNNVYVADYSNNRIQKFTADGEFITTWGSEGSGEGQFNAPIGIAVDSSDNVYVADADNDRIEKFTSDGTFITKWGSEGSGEGQFGNPHGIAVDSSDNLYVADWGNDRIEKFTSDGTFITKWGSEGSWEGQFGSPHGIAVDSQNNVYVADSFNDRIQVFAPSR
jgi:sugar lactone lactonase YvrE